jgi:hypothetical protein
LFLISQVCHKLSGQTLEDGSQKEFRPPQKDATGRAGSHSLTWGALPIDKDYATVNPYPFPKNIWSLRKKVRPHGCQLDMFAAGAKLLMGNL